MSSRVINKLICAGSGTKPQQIPTAIIDIFVRSFLNSYIAGPHVSRIFILLDARTIINRNITFCDVAHVIKHIRILQLCPVSIFRFY